MDVLQSLLRSSFLANRFCRAFPHFPALSRAFQHPTTSAPRVNRHINFTVVKFYGGEACLLMKLAVFLREVFQDRGRVELRAESVAVPVV